MAQHDPRLAEDLLHLQLIDLGIGQYAHLNFTRIRINQVGYLSAIRKHCACFC